MQWQMLIIMYAIILNKLLATVSVEEVQAKTYSWDESGSASGLFVHNDELESGLSVKQQYLPFAISIKNQPQMRARII